jgi:hypothetical protein
MADAAVLVLGSTALAADVAARTGRRVATEPGTLADAPAVVGVAAEPWPAYGRAHEQARREVAPAPYFAVQAWHQHPAYLDALAGGIAAVRPAADVHVLFTAPGPLVEPEPEDVVFLRETAEAVSRRAGIARRSIAWTSGVAGPSSRAALTALAEAHGRTEVLRCSLDPLGRPDDVAAEAAELGLALAEVVLEPDALPRLLWAVIDTVVEHEGLDGSPG